jgi:hypothetical protein
MERYLSDKSLQREIKTGALKNIHSFLKQCSPDVRKRFLPYVLQDISTPYSTEDGSAVFYDWR